MTKLLTRALVVLFCASATLAVGRAEPVGPRLPLHSAITNFCAQPTEAALHGARNAARSAHLRWMAVHHIEQARVMRSITPQVTQMISPRTWKDGKRKPKVGAFDQSPTQRTLAMIGVAMHGFSSLKHILFDDEITERTGSHHTRLCEQAAIISWHLSRLTELSNVRNKGLAPQDVRSIWRAAYLARSETARSMPGLSPFDSIGPQLASYSLIVRRRQHQPSQLGHRGANAFVRLFNDPYRNSVDEFSEANILQHTIMDLPARRLEAFLSHYMGDIRAAVILTLLKPESAQLTGS